MASSKMIVAKDGTVSYKISVSRGHGISPYTMRWHPQAGWSKRTIERELRKAEAEFEARCNAGEVKSRKEIAEEKKAAEEERAKILTVQQYGDQILLPTKRQECAPNTTAYYKNVLEKHIYPVFGSRKLTDISTDDLKAFLLKKQETDLSQTSLTAIYITLGQIFQGAYESDMIDRNPLGKIKKPRKSKTETKAKEYPAFTEKEVKEIISFLKNEPLKWQAFVLLLIKTGMRKGEACGLHWNDIDFKERTITIRHNLCYTPEKGVYDDAPKTNSSRRIIPVPQEVLNILTEYQDEQTDKKSKQKIISIPSPSTPMEDGGYVFTQRKGSLEPMHPQSPDRYFTKFGKRYGIEDFHPHKLRHTFASIAITNGADVASVSEILGHHNKATTMRMYTHGNLESMRRASEINNNAVKNA